MDQVVAVGVANAEGVRMARTAIVAFGEDWGQALLAAHRSTHAVVAPVFRNANPGSIVSWWDLLICYGAWMEPVEGGLRPFLPGHDSSYKRDELLAYGERLEDMLGSVTGAGQADRGRRDVAFGADELRAQSDSLHNGE